MLNTLYIQNYALIKEVSIEFGDGFNIITGETGAGKSILLGALSIILGERVDMGVMTDTDKKCTVEGAFKIGEYGLQGFFAENDLDYEELTTIRREITPGGKSRAFVNDTPVTLPVLKELGNRLVVIHSQHSTLELADLKSQLMLVDSVAKTQKELEQYTQAYKDYAQLVSDLKNIEKQAIDAQRNLDFLQFQFNELDALKLGIGEQEELEAELEQLTHSEEIKSALSHTANLLNVDGTGVLTSLNSGLMQLKSIVNFHPDAAEFAGRMESALIDMNDLATEIESLCEDVEHDPARIAMVNERLNLIYSLQKKHGVSTVDELIDLHLELNQNLSRIMSFDDELESLRSKLAKSETQLGQMADKLSQKRKKAFGILEKSILNMLLQLGMKNSSFKVDYESLEAFGPDGRDRIAFKFSSAKNSSLKDISKVASGGEMSRVMLAIKALVSENTALPTIVFDEIDTGVSGDIADKMGKIIKGMAANMQVINITHLPQVAAKGDRHYKVYKQDARGTVTSHIKQLDDAERETEIAQMLSGENLTQAALSNAKELLQSN